MTPEEQYESKKREFLELLDQYKPTLECMCELSKEEDFRTVEGRLLLACLHFGLAELEADKAGKEESMKS
jgi:hypothetical protein